MQEESKFTFSMMEYPFYHDGMTIEEWKVERKYMADHMEDVKNGTYKPLWKQVKNVIMDDKTKSGRPRKGNDTKLQIRLSDNDREYLKQYASENALVDANGKPVEGEAVRQIIREYKFLREAVSDDKIDNVSADLYTSYRDLKRLDDSFTNLHGLEWLESDICRAIRPLLDYKIPVSVAVLSVIKHNRNDKKYQVSENFSFGAKEKTFTLTKKNRSKPL